jgi:hypothetical protein
MVYSRRQYIFQFEKWGFHKYKTNTVDSSSSFDQSHIQTEAHGSLWASSHAVLTQNSSSTKAEEIPTNGQSSCQPITPASSKRPPSLTSLTKSLREKPPVPPKKRQKLADFLASKNVYANPASTDPYADLGLAFDMPETPLPSSQILPLSEVNNQQTEILYLDVDMISATVMTPSNVDHDVDMDMGTHNVLRDDDSWITTQSASDIAMSVLSSGSSNGLGLYYAGHSTSQDQLLDPEPLRERQIDSSRPIDTFSKDEVEDMKLAADFLQSLGCEEDAFSLYILIYKVHSHLQATENARSLPSWVMSSAVISCATCAFTSPQIEIARNLLLQKLNEPQDSTTTVEKFLFHMLLAETYARVNDDTTARSHIEIAMGLDLFADSGPLHGLPRKNRSYDILTYHYLTDGLGYQTLLGKASYDDVDVACESASNGFWHGTTVREGNNSNHTTQEVLFLDEWEAWNQLLLQVPGPFEIKDDKMTNPCLKSCLQWCIEELERVPTFSQSWNLVKSNRDNLVRAEVIGIYCCLWERWQSYKGPENSDSLLWAEQAESLMGISAAELLKTLCSLMISVSPHSTRRSERNLVRRALFGAINLSLQPDIQLGCIFLDRFSSLRTFFNASQKDVTFKNARQVYGKEFIEKRLRIKLPDVISHALRNTRQSLDVVAATFLPTLASSLHSSEMASLRTMRDRIRNAGGAVTEIAMTLPSSVLRDRRSNSTLPSMSELSAMASSLSLSSFQQAGSSAMSHVRERVAAIEGDLGDAMQRLIR